MVTRFAPSPTGFLHLGHAFSAHCACAAARAAGGRFLLRLEDIDSTRCRPNFATAILQDLQWLGLDWDGPVRVQSEHLPAYAAALRQLQDRGLLYPCFCSRAEITAALAAPHAMATIYPGTCRAISPATARAYIEAGRPYALRLNLRRAMKDNMNLRFHDADAGWVAAQPEIFGDAVLARRDVPASYHLCVVHDDAAQEVTHVIRGADLANATHLHVLLQHLLGLPVPSYRFHRLLTNATGQRLAKRDGAVSLASLRAAGASPADIIGKFL